MMGRPKDAADEENSNSFEGDGSNDGKFDDNDDKEPIFVWSWGRRIAMVFMSGRERKTEMEMEMEIEMKRDGESKSERERKTIPHSSRVILPRLTVQYLYINLLPSALPAPNLPHHNLVLMDFVALLLEMIA
jgi:hypothetical protein